MAQPRQRHGAVLSKTGEARAVAYTDKQHRIHDYKDAIRRAAQGAIGLHTPWDGPVEVGISFVLPRPKCLCRKKDPPGRLPCSKKLGDVDNLAKAVLDACQGICFVDDFQVWSLFVTKEYAAIGEQSHTLVAMTQASQET